MHTSEWAARRNAILALGAFLIAFILWQYEPVSFVVYPLRLFTTFIHELGHGAATLFTGGDFIRFEVKPSGAGLAYSNGGLRTLIIPAGYVGTALFGSILLYAANRARHPEWIAMGLGGLFIGLAMLYTGVCLCHLNTGERILAIGSLAAGFGYFLIADLDRGRWIGLSIALLGLLAFVYWGAGDNSLAIMVGVLSGVALILLGYWGWRGHRDITLFVLNFLAFVIGLNAITDAWFLLKIVRNDQLILRNDASAMAAEVGLSATFWAFLWIVTAIVLLGVSVWSTFFRPYTTETSRASKQPARETSAL